MDLKNLTCNVLNIGYYTYSIIIENVHPTPEEMYTIFCFEAYFLKVYQKWTIFKAYLKVHQKWTII